ncbi:MAG: hypothetical protein LBK69_06685, partial [Syntrophomonadaceae bacterium]|nr:hypothetical protein [Syntrophomonadaceae bacterium]
MPNKQQFLDIMNFQENGGVPAAFWFHFSPYDKLAYQVGQKDLWNNLIKEHQKYLRKVPNGIIKVMSDGYFTTPAAWDIDVRDPKALSSLKPTAQSHPWFEEQIELCRQVAASAEDTLVYYTVFSPLTTLFFSYWGRENGNDSDDIFSRSEERRVG